MESSAALNFNSEPPKSISLFKTVAIGWKHDVVDDQVVFEVDEDGEPVAQTYRIPTHVTAKDMIDRAAKLSPDRRAALEGGGMPGMLELSGLVVGDDLIERIASDPTVPTPTFIAFLESLLSNLDLAQITGGGSDPN